MKTIKSAFLRVVCGALALAATSAHAYTWDYHFGTAFSSSPAYQPQGTFAYLSVSTQDHLNFDFMLRAESPINSGNLESAFGSGSYINKAVFNTVSGDSPIAITNVQTNGAVQNVYLGSNDISIGGVTFDFFDCFSGPSLCHNGGNGTLQSGEWVSWSLSFATSQTPLLSEPPVAIHVMGFDVGGVTNGWYTPTSPIPEPEMYAMLLSGLGLMGFVARRRKRNILAA